MLPLASLVGHWLVPSALGGEGEPVAEQRTVEQFERLAYGLEAWREVPASGTPADHAARGAVAVESRRWPRGSWPRIPVDIVVAGSGTARRRAAGARPVWLVIGALPGGASS